MTRVKICGLTNAEDAWAAAALGADALGFIAVPESPRFVSPETVRQVVRGLPPFLTTVVVARQPIDSSEYPCEVVQFYGGDEQTTAMRRLRVFRVKDELSLLELRDYHRTADAFLLDTFHESALGGVGKTFDWSLALEAKRIAGDIPILLAGGLTPDNVAEAVRTVRPYAVDVSSGVEAEPGRKDHEKLRRFLDAVRSA
ncbi:MAG: phosphoribosylanthranilate isomerase [Capsulimonadales bacterium]|nr:phosphoribosylanthranilate isomerase [Capsulimonadales bacterium]